MFLAAPCDTDSDQIEQAEFGSMNNVFGEFLERCRVNEIGQFFAGGTGLSDY